MSQRKIPNKLLTHVIQGEQSEAEVMIKENPNLLTIRASAIDYSGRTIIATPFQAALGAGDKPMWEMMLPFFENLAGGEALKQFEEQFPPNMRKQKSAEALQYKYYILAKVIIKHKDHGQSLIKAFRRYITKPNEISHGSHFNLNHLVAAYKAYIDIFDAKDSWFNLNIFWIQVIGYVQRQMTAYDAQVLCSGVQSVLDDQAKLSRSLSYSNGDKFLPLSEEKGLGFEFAVNITHPGLSLKGQGFFWAAECCNLIRNYMEQKQTSLQDLKSHLIQACAVNHTNYS